MKLPLYPGHLFFLYRTVAKACRLYLELVSCQTGEMPWGQDCHQQHEVFTKQAPHKV